MKRDTLLMDYPYWEWFCEGNYSLRWQKGTILPDDAVKFMNDDFIISMTAYESGKRREVLIQSVMQKTIETQSGKIKVCPPYIKIMDPMKGIIENPYKKIINTFFIKK